MANRLAVGYARVSTSAQAEEFDALEQQIARLKSAGAEELLVDIESGRSDKRKEFNRLLCMIKEGGVEKLVVTRLDRLGRSVITLHRTLALMDECKVQLWVLDAPIDTNSPFGWFGLSQMSALAEFESRLLSSRIRHGMDYLRQQGKANPNAPFGYKRVNDKLTPNENWCIAQESINIYRRLGNLRATIAQVFERYEVKWSVAGFRDWLSNPVLRGHTVYHRWHNHNNPEKWDIRYDTHPPLINEQEWQEIDYLLKRGRQLWGKNANKTIHDYPLSGQIVCGVCRNNCYRYIARTGKSRMRCRKRDEGKHLCSNSQSVLLDDIEAAAIASLTQQADLITAFALTPDEYIEPPELSALKQQLRGLEALGRNPAIDTALADLKRQIDNYDYISSTESIIDDHARETITKLFGDSEFWQKADLDESDRRTVYRDLIEKVVIRDGAVVDVVLKI